MDMDEDELEWEHQETPTGEGVELEEDATLNEVLVSSLTFTQGFDFEDVDEDMEAFDEDSDQVVEFEEEVEVESPGGVEVVLTKRSKSGKASKKSTKRKTPEQEAATAARKAASLMHQVAVVSFITHVKLLDARCSDLVGAVALSCLQFPDVDAASTRSVSELLKSVDLCWEILVNSTREHMPSCFDDTSSQFTVILVCSILRAAGYLACPVISCAGVPHWKLPKNGGDAPKKKKHKVDPVAEQAESVREADVWVEVFTARKWHAVCLERGAMECLPVCTEFECYRPVSRVISSGHTLRDVTLRYTADPAASYKMRQKGAWLTLLDDQSIDDCPRDWREAVSADDKMIRKLMKKEKLPTSKSSFKAHPIFQLPSQLTRYRCIHPDAKPVAKFGEEDVFLIMDVYDTHSLEKWLEKGMQPIYGQIPVVRTENKRTKKDLNLFASFQMEPYVPGVAVNGVVPKNQHGNVYMYKHAMVPGGCTHLQLPGLKLRLCKKLNIDAARAVVGWKFRRGGSYPVMNGLVVANENVERLRNAWNAAISEQIDKAHNKKKAKIAKAWKKMALLLKNKRLIEARYDM